VSIKKAANKIGGMVALARTNLEAVRAGSQPLEVLGVW